MYRLTSHLKVEHGLVDPKFRAFYRGEEHRGASMPRPLAQLSNARSALSQASLCYSVQESRPTRSARRVKVAAEAEPVYHAQHEFAACKKKTRWTSDERCYDWGGGAILRIGSLLLSINGVSLCSVLFPCVVFLQFVVFVLRILLVICVSVLHFSLHVTSLFSVCVGEFAFVYAYVFLCRGIYAYADVHIHTHGQYNEGTQQHVKHKKSSFLHLQTQLHFYIFIWPPPRQQRDIKRHLTQLLDMTVVLQIESCCQVDVTAAWASTSRRVFVFSVESETQVIFRDVIRPRWFPRANLAHWPTDKTWRFVGLLADL